MSDVQPTTKPPPPSRSFGRGTVVLALIAGFAGGYATHYLITPTEAETTAQQFCALGTGSGASLLDVSGWLKAAQRTSDDWNEVLAEIESSCPLWRDQVADRADDFGD